MKYVPVLGSMRQTSIYYINSFQLTCPPSPPHLHIDRYIISLLIICLTRSIYSSLCSTLHHHTSHTHKHICIHIYNLYTHIHCRRWHSCVQSRREFVLITYPFALVRIQIHATYIHTRRSMCVILCIMFVC